MCSGEGKEISSKLSSAPRKHGKLRETQSLRWRGIKVYATPKYSLLDWLALKNRLAMGDRMVSWNAGVDSSCICIFCHGPLETRSHLFFTCPFSTEVWSGLARKLLSRQFSTNWETVIKLLTVTSLGKVGLFLTRYTFQLTLHSLRKERNNRRHGEVATSSAHLIRLLDKQVRNRIFFYS